MILKKAAPIATPGMDASLLANSLYVDTIGVSSPVISSLTHLSPLNSVLLLSFFE